MSYWEMYLIYVAVGAVIASICTVIDNPEFIWVEDVAAVIVSAATIWPVITFCFLFERYRYVPVWRRKP